MRDYGIAETVHHIYTQERVNRTARIHAREFLAYELQLR